jgi:hypothetical protein
LFSCHRHDIIKCGSFFGTNFPPVGIGSTMPRRLSVKTRKKLSRRMTHQRADPAFIAAHRRAMQRLWADPKFTAKQKPALRAYMKRRNADLTFRAKQVASVSIPPMTRAAIVAALMADPNARRVANKIGGASYKTVLRIAKAAGITLNRKTKPQQHAKLTSQQRSEAIRRRDQGESLSRLARAYNVDPSTISRLK